MNSNRTNMDTIFTYALLIACLVLTGLPRTQSVTKNPVMRDELKRNPDLSSPEDCARECHMDEPPKTCYFHFTIELYSTVGPACTVNETNQYQNNGQCVTADGFERTILSVNRMLPGPSIQVCKGDKVIIDVANHMMGMDNTIHWHGLFQKGSPYFDGVPYVTQCPILSGNTFRYQWVAENAGTHFWHSHDGLQKLDGIYGSLIVRESKCKEPNRKLYDEDLTTHVMLVSDWMHEEATERYPGLRTRLIGQVPISALINGKGQFTDRTTGNTTKTPLAVFTIKPGRRYRFRMINSYCSACPAQVTIQGHDMTLIATDGVSVHPVNVHSIISFSGERYDFIINGNQPLDAYWIQLRSLGQCGEKKVQQLGILRYEGGPDYPTSDPPTYEKSLRQGVVMNPLDGICDFPRKDAVCVSQLTQVNDFDKEILTSEPDVNISLQFELHQYTSEELFRRDTYNPYLLVGSHLAESVINNISFSHTPSPPLSQLKDIRRESFCDGDDKPANCGTDQIRSCAHKKSIPVNSIVELCLVDANAVPDLSHPFHLHGYNFRVVSMGRLPDKNLTQITADHVRDLDRRGLLKRNRIMAPSKDTIAVPNNGFVIVRFRANNPGWWLLHCHILFHTITGMVMILHVGNARDLPAVPQNFPTCGNYLPEITPASKNDVRR